ncbi:MFS general substrate transporter [Dothidotthia symphoricarpi CBS 119687]|uniref:MFS general substrate transporter n=1 Tax=Dothidotthia symphoricarpi CBS 119687 TaxID=1392245 RepID=A0A6A6A0L1_9PLEO|nr:MFS general substrate transporter [Dothidotthia symphoricarpi CBS 119687]KAF2125379.1 MFS general substrate transporter [Dothidotthia symphoricarpi CBS 119687]
MAPDPKDAPFPTKQLIIIGICRFSEPLAFNSILAYSSLMVQDLGIHERDAPFYAGLLVSAYAVAEAMTAPLWGTISDVYGRKPIALIGLLGVAMSSILFGVAETYWVALLARFVGGALNGNVAIMQTMVAEMVKNPAHEPRAYATQPFVWTLGGIIGSAMGGFLARPAVFYPNAFAADGLFGRYPYLLPNLVAAIGILLAIVQGMLFLEETLVQPEKEEENVHGYGAIDHHGPDVHERSRLLAPHGHPYQNPRDRDVRGSFAQSVRGRGSIASFTRERLGSISVQGSIRHIRKRASFMEEGMPLPYAQNFDIRRASFGTMHSIRVAPHNVLPMRQPPTQPRKTMNRTVVMIIVAMAIFAFHQMAFITTLPVYILDEPTSRGLDFKGGLGLTLHDVGAFLAINGFISLFVQGFVFPIFVEHVGVWKSFVWMIILYPTTYVIIPFISALPTEFETFGVYFSLILQAFYGIIVFPCALILMKNATPSPLVLGRVNGLAMSACCLARTFSSPLVGLIYSLGGSAAAWFGLTIIAVIGVVQLIWVPKEDVGPVEIENVLKKVIHHEDDDDNAVDDVSVIDSVR